MPDCTVNNLGLEKHLNLLRDVVPNSVDLYACNASGRLIAAADGNARNTTAGDWIVEGSVLSGLAENPRGACMVPGFKKRYLTPVCNTLDEPVVYLVAILNDHNESQEDVTENLISRSCSAVASCIEKEYNLTAELDAMALELAGRYEELNLIYGTTDDITDFENEGHTLTNLIEKYIEHLDVDMIALAFPKQERVFSATNGHDPIPEAYEIILNLGRNYSSNSGDTGKFIIINDFTDPQRDRYHLHVPCKIMACPVLNSRGTSNGILICINHMQRTDFFNSDKNLLSVMSKKVAKIVQSNYDVMTGLINQHAFEYVIQDAIKTSRRKGLFHCVLNIDLDKLKVINDSLGREAGDHIIQSVADLIHNKLRNADTVSYLGEGRYGALLEQCTMEQGMQVSESLRNLVRESEFTWESVPVEASISIGMVLIEPHTQSIDEVLESVEMARDAAKEGGYNRIHLYRQSDNDIALRKEHLGWVARIQQALRNDEFITFCQTISPVSRTSERYHFEVLLRMVDKDGSIITPNKFIPPAERFNLMPTIDRWVINHTMNILSSEGLAQKPGDGVISINLSGQSLADRELTSYIIDKADRYRIAPDCICFEITETSAIRDIAIAQDIFKQLKARGFKLSLDDFGTGLSTFSYLKNMPVDYLKIDGSFVRTILDDNIAFAMVASINHVGHVMGLKTICEYVESDELATQLTNIGVDYLQGYAIGKPVDLRSYISGLHLSTPACAG